MAHLLLIRFSALGDVAMTVPVLRAVAEQYPQHRFTMVSRQPMEAYFQGLPENVQFHGVDLKAYKGLSGLSRLYQELKALEPDAVCDWHDVLRTQYLRIRFALSGIPVKHIQKGRSEKRALVKVGYQQHAPLKSAFQRYAEVLCKLGYAPSLDLDPSPDLPREGASFLKTGVSGVRRIGVAPFAAHAGKIYPLEQMKVVVGMLAHQPDTEIYLFGGGPKEKEILGAWASELPQVESMVGKYNRQEELEFMRTLDVMLCMDSGNMHLASLVGVPVVSIWGATHPAAGFLGWGQREENCIQLPLSCRPCSIFGNKPCKYGDYRCLRGIKPETIVEKVNSL